MLERERIDELWHRSQDRGLITRTNFLSPAEQMEIQKIAHIAASVHFVGGQGGAERQVAYFLPDPSAQDWLTPEEDIKALKFHTAFFSPSHRDILGSLLGLGLERWTIGDIITQEEWAFCYCLANVEGFILEHLEKIGRSGVRITEIPWSQVPQKQSAGEIHMFSVSGLRLDAVLAASFHLSRGRVQEAIVGGLVQLNHSPCIKPTREVKVGDVFSLRGHGKAKLVEISGETRKNRIRIQVELYG